jgi:uracil phosphoribosyltransferase
MIVHNLALENSVLNQFVTEIRDIEIQKDSMRFRKNLERIGEIFAYEISKTLNYDLVETTTPLGVAKTKALSSQPVIVAVLRAGLPFHLGVLNIFDKAGNGFIGAYRRHRKNNSFEIALEYTTCPDVSDKTVILCDPMLASGASLILAYRAIIAKGIPKHTHIISAIASAEGLDYVKTNLPSPNCTVWCGAIDQELTAQAYIVPGLGDAGDLAYGNKL